MKPKLAIFTKFCEDLLPIELAYVQQQAAFKDEDLTSILNKLLDQKNKAKAEYSFDIKIDKRKYSFFKTWVQEILEETDVDIALHKIQQFDAKVQTDSITNTEEKELVKAASTIDNTYYHFQRFYELMLHFRQYLLIRMRMKNYQLINEWIEQYKVNYTESLRVYNMLHELSGEIISEYGLSNHTDIGVESSLQEIFENDLLDGLNRYAAAVRLWFYYMNKGEYVKMAKLLDDVEQLLIQKKYLGRRIIVNYYANRLLLHSKTSELEKARYYGYLSLKYPTNDYLFYVINLSSVLLRLGLPKEAMQHMKDAFPVMRSTLDMHNKIGFVAHYVHCLIDLGNFKEATKFAENYLGSHLKEVMSTRWHLFFAAYFRSLVLLNNFPRVLLMAKRYKLKEKEMQYATKAHYLPTMSWYISLAEFMEGDIDEKTAIEKMKSSALILINDPIRGIRIAEQLTQLQTQVPGLIKKLRSELNM